MITPFDIGKLAGLIEGEGTVYTNQGSPCIQFGCSDLDTVQWVSGVFRTRVMGPYQLTGNQKKPHYRAYVYGARAAGLLMTMYCGLGKRRQAAARSTLQTWRSKPVTGIYTYHTFKERAA